MSCGGGVGVMVYCERLEVLCGKGRMSWCTVRGWRWERQDVMVYCERLEMGKAGCHGVL